MQFLGNTITYGEEKEGKNDGVCTDGDNNTGTEASDEGLTERVTAETSVDRKKSTVVVVERW
jgi:hypothetical protein